MGDTLEISDDSFDELDEYELGNDSNSDTVSYCLRPTTAAWRRIEQLREEKQLRRMLEEFYDE